MSFLDHLQYLLLLEVSPKGGNYKSLTVDQISAIESVEIVFDIEDPGKSNFIKARFLNQRTGPGQYKFSDEFSKLLSGNMKVSWTSSRSRTNMSTFIEGQIRKGNVKFPSNKGSTVELTAYGLNTKLNQEVKSRKYPKEQTSSQIAQKIAGENGLTAVLDDDPIKDSGEQDWIQGNQSDNSFLKDLANRINYDFYIQGNDLHFHSKSKKLNTPFTLSYSLLPTSIVKSVTVEFNDDVESGGKAQGISRKNKKVISESTTETSGGGNAVVGETQSGTRISKYTGSGSSASGGSSNFSVNADNSGKKVAKSHGAGRSGKSTQSRYKVKVVCLGHPLLKAGTVINLVGIGSELSGLYRIRKASHKMDSKGYICTLELEADPLEGKRSLAGAVKDAATNPLNSPALESITEVVAETQKGNRVVKTIGKSVGITNGE